MSFWIKTASVFMFIGVLLGAFGAHGLKERLSAENLAIYHTATFYHFVHALALFIVAWLLGLGPNRKILFAGWAFLAGIFLFSGSLYLLAITNVRWLGMITPLGGVFFLAGWVSLIFCSKV